MLVLSRQRDETIMIGDEIEITIVDIRGDKVRLGITAPTRVSVHRKEVYDAIKAENENASAIRNGDLDILRRTISTGPVKLGGAAINKPRLLSTPAAAGSGRPAVIGQVGQGGHVGHVVGGVVAGVTIAQVNGKASNKESIGRPNRGSALG